MKVAMRHFCFVLILLTPMDESTSVSNSSCPKDLDLAGYYFWNALIC